LSIPVSNFELYIYDILGLNVVQSLQGPNFVRRKRRRVYTFRYLKGVTQVIKEKCAAWKIVGIYTSKVNFKRVIRG
jgi:hypothetical protein